MTNGTPLIQQPWLYTCLVARVGFLEGNNDYTTRQLQNLHKRYKTSCIAKYLCINNYTVHATFSSHLSLASSQKSAVKVKSVRWMAGPWRKMMLIEGLTSVLESASCFMFQLCGQHLDWWCLAKLWNYWSVPWMRQVIYCFHNGGWDPMELPAEMRTKTGWPSLTKQGLVWW